MAPINSWVKQAEVVGCSEIRGAKVVKEHFGEEFMGLAEPGGSRSSTSTLGGPQLHTRKGCRSTQCPPPDHGSRAASLRVAFLSPSQTWPCTPALSTHPSLVPCTTIPSQSGALGEKSPDLGLCARGRTSWFPPSQGTIPTGGCQEVASLETVSSLSSWGFCSRFFSRLYI